ncbi:hypothetical protein EC396_16585 [Lutibacter sp. HS1-25]|uniref:DUF5335 family protein n=1 Tax=Lutibacter sp. HS1-25 TaxID=2485000 RepID=UPI0010112BB9|nr:DUF5335 family protein [Lutibacter sp. HS1-25]RXP44778.1 hypothetical protein EC396_16585 [Lutibacter sp. HS1-25]
MSITKQIQPENWIERVSVFSDDNKGRLVSITLCNSEILVDEIPLMSVNYNYQFKGYDMVISVGGDAVELNHIINAPLELWETQNDYGDITSIEIIDFNNNEYIVTFCK